MLFLNFFWYFFTLETCCLGGFHLRIALNLINYVLFVHTLCMSCLSKICPDWNIRKFRSSLELQEEVLKILLENLKEEGILENDREDWSQCFYLKELIESYAMKREKETNYWLKTRWYPRYAYLRNVYTIAK